jgi:hypothetical protein
MTSRPNLSSGVLTRGTTKNPIFTAPGLLAGLWAVLTEFRLGRPWTLPRQ